MKHRIKHPAIEGSVYIAEAVISRLEHSAVKRCGAHDILYEQLFSQEVTDFALTLTPTERDKFLDVVADMHSGYEPDSYLLIPDTIEEINQSYNL